MRLSKDVYAFVVIFVFVFGFALVGAGIGFAVGMWRMNQPFTTQAENQLEVKITAHDMVAIQANELLTSEISGYRPFSLVSEQYSYTAEEVNLLALIREEIPQIYTIRETIKPDVYLLTSEESKPVTFTLTGKGTIILSSSRTQFFTTLGADFTDAALETSLLAVFASFLGGLAGTSYLISQKHHVSSE